MSKVLSAKLNRYDPRAHIRDVIERMLAQPASRIDELPPRRSKPTLTA